MEGAWWVKSQSSNSDVSVARLVDLRGYERPGLSIFIIVSAVGNSLLVCVGPVKTGGGATCYM